jgi:hypothetical protein
MSDSYMLWRRIANVPSRLHPTPDSPRVIRRWLAVLGDLGATIGTDRLDGTHLVDLGTFMGDFCGMAAAAGMAAKGYDLGGFVPGVDSLAEGKKLWSPWVAFERRDMTEVTPAELSVDVVLLFSAWAYVLADHGRAKAEALLGRIMASAGVLYFETQLSGDGPGPSFFLDDNDVLGFLGQFGIPTPIVTIPVTGRPTVRTVWRVAPK